MSLDRRAIVATATLSAAVLVALCALPSALTDLVTTVSAQDRTAEEAAAAAKDKALRAKRLAQEFERDARVLTVFDRQGKVVTAVGERAIFGTPIFSPDGRRLAVNKRDLESDTQDLWVLDVATGKSLRITSSQKREPPGAVVWSPDGSQVAYQPVVKVDNR